jgi:hypothetical protein
VSTEIIKRRLYLLECLNPAVVTQEVASDAKWAVECMKLLAGYAAASPSAPRDKRVKVLIEALLG